MVICLERGADLHMAQLMPVSLAVSCFGKIQIGFTFWYQLTWVVPEKGPLNGCNSSKQWPPCVYVCVGVSVSVAEFHRGIKTRDQYVGCMRRLRIAGESVDLAHQLRSTAGRLNLVACPTN